MSDKIGSLIIDFQGTELSPEEKEMLAHPIVGGAILFTRNYASREQLKQLCQTIRSARSQPLLIMVDQEGGRVQRFIKDFTRLPPMESIGNFSNNNPEGAYQLAHDCGWLLACELISAGIDLSLAPVLDLNKGINPAIGTRAFHADPNAVIQLATAFFRGMREAGMAATGKHFPGHGSISIDSHKEVPIDPRSLYEIEQDDMIPFAGLVKAGISAIMAAHIIFPQVDPSAVSFSRFWLHEMLRNRLKFNGIIFSDDLNMEGANISANYADRVVAAREAGCDFVLLCQNQAGVIQVLDQLPFVAHQVEKNKWGLLQGDFSRNENPYQNQSRWQKTRQLLKNLE